MQGYSNGNAEIRDIRADLEERARLIEAEILAASADFDAAVRRLQDALRARLAALGTTMLADEYRAFLSDLIDSDRIR
jgi:hypothetical protein